MAAAHTTGSATAAPACNLLCLTANDSLATHFQCCSQRNPCHHHSSAVRRGRTCYSAAIVSRMLNLWCSMPALPWLCHPSSSCKQMLSSLPHPPCGCSQAIYSTSGRGMLVAWTPNIQLNSALRGFGLTPPPEGVHCLSPEHGLLSTDPASICVQPRTAIPVLAEAADEVGFTCWRATVDPDHCMQQIT